jgi:beta-lactamase superfamily II metal-dependent hydrolase
VPPVLSKIEIAQYVIRLLSYTYTTVLSKSFSYKKTGTSSTQGFVDGARPALAVVSVGRDSTYGHPHAEVLARWRSAGVQVLTTGERGTITVSTDGEDLKVETFVKR